MFETTLFLSMVGIGLDCLCFNYLGWIVARRGVGLIPEMYRLSFIDRWILTAALVIEQDTDSSKVLFLYVLLS